MHQAFGGQAPPGLAGELTALPKPPSCIKGSLLLREGMGREWGGEKRGGEGGDGKGRDGKEIRLRADLRRVLNVFNNKGREEEGKSKGG